VSVQETESYSSPGQRSILGTKSDVGALLKRKNDQTRRSVGALCGMMCCFSTQFGPISNRLACAIGNFVDVLARSPTAGAALSYSEPTDEGGVLKIINCANLAYTNAHQGPGL
jgi:hypothetical protein